MAGFRTFATGEVLTAANVNDFLMKQSVMVFADDAARTTALGAEVAEGMLTFNKDTGALEVFDGSDFVPAGAEPNLVAVKFAVKTNRQSSSVTAGGSVAISGLTIAHAVADAAHEVHLMAAVSGSAGVPNRGWGGAITAGGTELDIGGASGSNTRVGGADGANGDSAAMAGLSVIASHTPGSTGSVTYGVNVYNIDTNTRTLQVNRPVTLVGDASGAVGASTLILFEVRA